MVNTLTVNRSYEDRELLSRIAEGDENAFNQLFDRLWGHVYSATLRLTKSPELSKDLSQEVFLRLWQHRDRLPGITNIHAFLYTITKNLVTDFLRTKVFRENNQSFLTSYFAHDDTDILKALETKEKKEWLREAVGQLPSQLRQVVELAYFEGKNHKEIAAVLQITPASSRIYLVRAIASLRKNVTPGRSGLSMKLLLLAILP